MHLTINSVKFDCFRALSIMLMRTNFQYLTRYLPTAMNSLAGALPPYLQGPQTGTSEMTPYRNAVKMVVACTSWMCMAAESEAVAESKQILVRFI